MATTSGRRSFTARTIASMKPRPMVGPTCTSVSCTMVNPSSAAGSPSIATRTVRTVHAERAVRTPHAPASPPPPPTSAARPRAKARRRSGSWAPPRRWYAPRSTSAPSSPTTSRKDSPIHPNATIATGPITDRGSARCNGIATSIVRAKATSDHVPARCHAAGHSGSRTRRAQR